MSKCAHQRFHRRECDQNIDGSVSVADVVRQKREEGVYYLNLVKEEGPFHDYCGDCRRHLGMSLGMSIRDDNQLVSLEDIQEMYKK